MISTHNFAAMSGPRDVRHAKREGWQWIALLIVLMAAGCQSPVLRAPVALPTPTQELDTFILRLLPSGVEELSFESIGKGYIRIPRNQAFTPFSDTTLILRWLSFAGRRMTYPGPSK